MNFGRMITVTRTLLGETNANNSYWDDTTDIKPMINDAALAVASRTEGLFTFCDYLTTQGDGRYALKSDYLKLRKVHLFESEGNKYKLQHLSYDEFEAHTGHNPTTQGRPRVYKLELGAVSITSPLPGDIWVYPVPDAGGGLGSGEDQYRIRISYYQKPTEMTDTANHTTELPENAHMAVCYYAAMHLSMMADNRSRYSDLKALYEQEIRTVMQYYNRKQRDSSVRMKDVMSYGRSSLGRRGGRRQ